MASYAVVIDLPDHVRGDRWVGIGAIGPVLINGVTPANALTRIVMRFMRRGDGLEAAQLYVIDSQAGANALVVISNAATWQGSIAPVQNFLPLAGEWAWDMAFYDAGNASPLTLYTGVLTVQSDV